MRQHSEASQYGSFDERKKRAGSSPEVVKAVAWKETMPPQQLSTGTASVPLCSALRLAPGAKYG